MRGRGDVGVAAGPPSWNRWKISSNQFKKRDKHTDPDTHAKYLPPVVFRVNRFTVHSGSSKRSSECFQHLTILCPVTAPHSRLLPSRRSRRHGSVVMTETGGAPGQLLFVPADLLLPPPLPALTPPLTAPQKLHFQHRGPVVSFYSPPHSRVDIFCSFPPFFFFFKHIGRTWPPSPAKTMNKRVKQTHLEKLLSSGERRYTRFRLFGHPGDDRSR